MLLEIRTRDPVSGVDIKLCDKAYLNLGLKMVQVRSDAPAGATGSRRVKPDPRLIGAGPGRRP